MSGVRKNFLYQSAYQIISILMPMVISPYISRVLGAEGIGLYSYSFSIVSYFVLFARLGIQTYGNRVIATQRDDKEKLSQAFADLYSLQFLVSVVVCLAFAVYLLFFCRENRLIFALQGLLIIGQLFDINWFYFGIERFRLTVIRSIIMKFLIMVSIFLFVNTKADVWKYVAIMAVFSAIGEFSVWFFLRKHIYLRKPIRENQKSHILPLLHFFLPSIAISLYKIMDKIMLGIMSDTVQVGLYENAESLTMVGIGFITAMGQVMLPRMTHLLAGNREEEGRILTEQSMDVLLALTVAITFGMIGISGVFPTVFWGSEFSACSPLIIGLSLSLLFMAPANVLRMQYIIPRHMDKIYRISIYSGAGVNVILNLLLIPRLQAWGTVIGTLGAEFTVFAIQSFAVRKGLPLRKYLGISCRYLPGGILISVYCVLAGRAGGVNLSTLILQILGGMVLYGIFFLGITVFTNNRMYLDVLEKLKVRSRKN